ncbi:MAG: Rpn family recombination-promoting nuclease/putative transposase [Lachnospiraceae bacterium]|nr:Rpn family recombination-promoting nuclease/putative transposase [Lachnospiraceae bacterium]
MPINKKHSFTGELPYKLTNDFFFKAFLEKNETALRGLLCALLSMKPEEIISVTITNPIKPGSSVDDKDMILDVKVLLNSQEIINLEMQVNNLGNWPERSLSYLCRMFDQLKEGENYKTVKKTIHISITDFTPTGFPKLLYSDYFLYNLKTLHKYSDKFGIYMLQLNQLGNPEDEKNIPDVYYWAQLFKAKTWEEIQMLAQKNDIIHQSIPTLQELTADEEMRMKMEARERYRLDYEAAVEFGRQQIQEQLSLKDEQLSQKDKNIHLLQAENAEKEERIRILEKQLAEANHK